MSKILPLAIKTTNLRKAHFNPGELLHFLVEQERVMYSKGGLISDLFGSGGTGRLED